MFKRLFRRDPMRAAIQQEGLSMRHANQIDMLALSPHLRRDIGHDNGRLTPAPSHRGRCLDRT